MVLLLSLILWCSLNIVDANPISAEDLQKMFPGVNMEERRMRLAKLGFQSVNGAAHIPQGEKAVMYQQVTSARPSLEFPSIGQINRKYGIDEYLYQGDINLTEKQLAALEEHSERQHTRTRRQVRLDVDKWSNATVYYYLDDSVGNDMIDLIKSTIRYFEDNTCIIFKQDRTAENRIKILNGTGCVSNLGMNGGEQPLTLGEGCYRVGIVYHEFLHALGYVHTQARYDRDDYLQIDLTNVRPDMQHNYDKYEKDKLKIFTPFEYGSTMEYGADEFNDGSFSIIPRDIRYLGTLGTRIVSYYDTIMVNRYYCQDSCKNRKRPLCANGGMVNPSNCSKCICPSGYGGNLCDQRPSGCGAELKATPKWKSVTVKIGKEGYGSNEFSFCNYWIRAPAGKQPQTRINFMPDQKRCMLGCLAHGIQFKTENRQMTNILYCCKNDTATYEIRTSQLNPMPVIVHNHIDDFPVVFQYRYI